MKTDYFYWSFIGVGFLIILLLSGCDKSPKVISPTESASGSTGIFSGDTAAVTPVYSGQLGTEDLHTVTILEVLPTVKYVYLRVKEGQEEFWIATLKTEIAVGEDYFYRGGLLKTNFESREHKRVFDKMYLVSSLVKADHGIQPTSTQRPLNDNEMRAAVTVTDVIKISDLVTEPKKYNGKTIQIRGNCIKVNSNIMGRNWIHIQDGSQDDFDLVITSTSQVPVGHTITMSGKVVLDKDFGSGYKYSIILEEGELVQ